MKIISPANQTVMQMLKNFRKPGTKYRKLKYLVDTEVEDAILLFNLFTRELVLLTKEEFENATENEYLRKQWFVVPIECDEKKYVDFVKSYIKSKQSNFKEITGYTIFTTTDCNARCYYCFELGRSRIPMNPETALKTAKYIQDHCGNNIVKLSWFGGEPLMNTDAIDIICSYLKKQGIKYKSKMTSNGYLFSKEIISKAKIEWNLQQIQITLDGTESVYNRIKAYVDNYGNPFRIVLRNIEQLLDAKIQVIIRLNMDLSNAEDLLVLIKELSRQFKNRKGLYVYAHHLFKDGTPSAELYTNEEWESRDLAMQEIECLLNQNNLSSKGGITKTIKANHCMADSGNSVTILPDGSIGLCEHYTNSGFIGHIDNVQLDFNTINQWKEPIPEIPACTDCFYYPMCVRIKRCSTDGSCYPQYIKEKHRKISESIQTEYLLNKK